jgi:hypothetical protein
MATDLKKSRRKFDREASEPEPAWDIARLFPAQGEWSEEDYLELDTNRLVEFSTASKRRTPSSARFKRGSTRRRSCLPVSRLT